MIKPTRFIHAVAMRCLGGWQELQSIMIEEELELVRQAIHKRLDILEMNIRTQDESMTAPDDQYEESQ